MVRVSIGGDTLRIKFSNKTCSTPVTINSVYIAESNGGSAVDASTNTKLKFGGDTSVTMDAYSSITSDPVAFPLTPSMRLAITVYYGEAASTVDMTSHVASRTDSYIVTGNQASAADFTGETITAHWFHINTVDVRSADTAGCVAVLGNSLTDGYGLSGGLQNRWTDIFSQKLLDDERTKHIGVLNLGIGATTLAGSGPTTGLSRYQDDLLTQSGLRWIIIFNGTNDIGGGASATTIINACQTIIDDAHAMNIKVYGATITPFKGHYYYTEAHEEVRNTVNEWIRTPGNFDACIDFDKTIRDPNDTAKLTAEYSNDWLHPNAAGYAFLGNSVDLNLFTEIESSETLFANAGSDQTLVDLGDSGCVSVKLNGSRSLSWSSDIVSYVWSEDETQIATGENPEVDLTVGTHTITLTVTDKDGKTDSDDVFITLLEDSGIWLEAECGTVGTLWDIKSDENASNDHYVTVKTGNNSTGSAPADAAGLISYTFDVEEGGTHNLYARLICPSPNDDSFWIKMDNGSFAMWNNIPAPTWQWVNFTSGFSLSKGGHTLTIGYREDGALMDKLWITDIRADVIGEGSAAGNCNASALNYESISCIELYPNPVSEEINITIPDSPFEVSMYNSNGELLFKQDTQARNMTVNMANYPTGMHIIRITNQYQTIAKKIIKQ